MPRLVRRRVRLAVDFELEVPLGRDAVSYLNERTRVRMLSDGEGSVLQADIRGPLVMGFDVRVEERKGR